MPPVTATGLPLSIMAAWSNAAPRRAVVSSLSGMGRSHTRSPRRRRAVERRIWVADIDDAQALPVGRAEGGERAVPPPDGPAAVAAQTTGERVAAAFPHVRPVPAPAAQVADPRLPEGSVRKGAPFHPIDALPGPDFARPAEAQVVRPAGEGGGRRGSPAPSRSQRRPRRSRPRRRQGRRRRAASGHRGRAPRRPRALSSTAAAPRAVRGLARRRRSPEPCRRRPRSSPRSRRRLSRLSQGIGGRRGRAAAPGPPTLWTPTRRLCPAPDRHVGIPRRAGRRPILLRRGGARRPSACAAARRAGRLSPLRRDP